MFESIDTGFIGSMLRGYLPEVKFQGFIHPSQRYARHHERWGTTAAIAQSADPNLRIAHRMGMEVGSRVPRYHNRPRNGNKRW